MNNSCLDVFKTYSHFLYPLSVLVSTAVYILPVWSWCVTGVRSRGLRGLLPVAVPLTCSSVSFAPWRCRTLPCTSPLHSGHGPPQCLISPLSRAASPSTQCSCASTFAVSEVFWQQPKPNLRVRAQHPPRVAASWTRLIPTCRYALPPHLLCQMTCYLWIAKPPDSPFSSATATLKVTFISKFQIAVLFSKSIPLYL